MAGDKLAKVNCEWPGCSQSFKSKSGMKTHVNSVHRRLKPFHCNSCDYKSSNKSGVQNHIKAVHLKLKPFPCNLCNFQTATQTTLNQHIRSHLGEKLHKCDDCSHSCGSRADLEHHRAHVHSDLRPFSCELCEYKGKSKSVLHQHRLTHFPEASSKKCQCPRCPFKTKSNATLRNHMTIHGDERPFGCSQCSFRAKTRKGFSTHLKVHSEVRNFECPHCDFRSKTSGDIKEHIILRHTDIRPFPCRLPGCSSKFAKNSVLQKHIRTVHQKETRYQCPLCPQRCFFKSALEIHILRHTNEKTFKCEHCDYTSIDFKGVRSHMGFAHSSSYSSYSCNVCGARFKTKDSLRVHQMARTSSTTLKCQWCRFRTISKCSLFSHKSKYHPGVKNKLGSEQLPQTKEEGTTRRSLISQVVAPLHSKKIKREASSAVANLVCKPCIVLLNRI